MLPFLPKPRRYEQAMNNTVFGVNTIGYNVAPYGDYINKDGISVSYFKRKIKIKFNLLIYIRLFLCGSCFFFFI